MAFWAAITLLTLTVAGYGDGARILGLFPIPAKSHMMAFSPLLEELAHRGHQVTVVSAFQLRTPTVNITDITIDSTIPDDFLKNAFSLEKPKYPHQILGLMGRLSLILCRRALEHPEMQKLIEEKELEFDVIILEIFFSECFYGFVHKYKAPLIHISSNVVAAWMGDGAGNPFTPAYIPEILYAFPDRMTYIERVKNTIANVGSFLFREYSLIPRHTALMLEHFKDPSISTIREMESNVSLVLLNSHYSLGYPRPYTPNTIEVAGMHIKPAKKLPMDLQKIMDEATHGVVYFSFGSNFRSKDLPIPMRDSLVEVFSKLKQTVLWKWDADTIPGLPGNVHISKWMPQNDILAHPNIKVFITHSGLLSTQEATYHAVPLLAIPIAADQISNANLVHHKGYAIMLRPFNVTTESLTWALDELLNDPRYRENAKRVSALFRDQLHSPLEKAVYWTEYVIRHKGAPHLRSAALDLWWFQYYLLDLMAALAFGIIVLWVFCCTLYGLVATKRTRTRKYSRAKKSN